MKEKYGHILFDIDGTLIDTVKTAMLSLQKTIKELKGEDVAEKELLYYYGIPTRDTIELLNFPDKDAAAERWEHNYLSLQYLTAPFHGMEEALKRYSDEGFKLGVISSRMRKENDLDPNFRPVEHFFKHIICAEDSADHKPKPGPVLTYLERTGASKDECVYVGDALADSLCAAAAGVDFILMSWRGYIPAGISYKALAHNFDELNEILLH